MSFTLQAARVQSEQAGGQLLNGNNVQPITEQSSKEIQTSMAPASFVSAGDREQSAPLMYAPQVSFAQNSGPNEEDPRKSAAAAVAAKLTASTSSAQMLSYVLSSLASEGVIGNPIRDSSADYQPEKRAKLENDQSSYMPSQSSQQPQLPPFSFSESILHNAASTTNQQSTPNEPPPPPSSSPPPLPPLPPMAQYPVPQYMQTSGSVNNMTYSYSVIQQPSMAAFPAVGPSLNNASSFAPPMNAYQGFQGPDGNYYNHPSSMPMTPISRQ